MKLPNRFASVLAGGCVLGAAAALAAQPAPAAGAGHANHGGAAPHADPHAAHRAAADAGEVRRAAARVRLEGAELVDRRGRSLRFPEDVVGDRIVAIGFIYTTCTTVCPLVSSVFSTVQESLGAGASVPVRLISLSIDPVTDTPRRLSDYADKFGARDEWLWLTGGKPQMVQVLKGLGAYTPDFTAHPPMVLVGDARADRWTRFNGLPDPQQLLAEIDRLRAARTDGTRAAR